MLFRSSTAYHPQTQGQVENLNGWLETFLRMHCNFQKDNWADLLHMAEFAWNNHYHSSLGMTPFYANYGMHPMMTDAPVGDQRNTPLRIKRLLDCRENICVQLEDAQRRQKKYYDARRDRAPAFGIGDKVYVSTENMITDEGSKKLSDLRTGPFEIVGTAGDSAFRLKLPPHMKCHSVFNESLLSQWKPDPITTRSPAEPPPVIIDGHEEYEIERILDANWYNKHFQYKVTYRGYGKEHDEWQFRDDLLEDMGKDALMDMEAAFYAAHPRAKRYTDSVKERSMGKPGMKKKS